MRRAPTFFRASMFGFLPLFLCSLGLCLRSESWTVSMPWLWCFFCSVASLLISFLRAHSIFYSKSGGIVSCLWAWHASIITWRLIPSMGFSTSIVLLSSISLTSMAIVFCVLGLLYSSRSGDVSLFWFLVWPSGCLASSSGWFRQIIPSFDCCWVSWVMPSCARYAKEFALDGFWTWFPFSGFLGISFLALGIGVNPLESI